MRSFRILTSLLWAQNQKPEKRFDSKPRPRKSQNNEHYEEGVNLMRRKWEKMLCSLGLDWVSIEYGCCKML